MSALVLTEEQKRRIEENRQRAIAIRKEKQSPVKYNSALQLTSLTTTSNVISNPVNSFNNRLQTTNNACTILHLQPVVTSQTADSANRSNNWTTTNRSAVYVSQKCAASKETILKTAGPTLSGKCIFVGNGSFAVEIGYSAPLIAYFKQMKALFDPSSKLWSFQMEDYITFMKGVHNFQPNIKIEGLPSWILQTFNPDKPNVMDVVPNADLCDVDAKLVETLLPFQREGVDVAIHHNGRLLIADDMGLGKTLQAICISCYYRNEWPLLIVCPSSVRFDWAQQICKWLPSVAPCDITIVETGKDNVTSTLISIISYDLLSKKSKELKNKFKVIIMDESHFLKNAKTVRTTAAMPLLKSAKRVLLLSGTPALSRPSELYSQITAVCPNLFKYHEFGLRYCNAKKMQWGWDYSSSSNMVELQALLEKRIMIRRLKKDVLSQLPAKYRQVIMLSPHSVHKHQDLKMASQTLSSSKLKGLNNRGALLEYFHETCKAKLSAVRDYILDLIEADKKFLMFAHHKEMLDCVEDSIKSKASHIEYIRIDGRTTSEQRNLFCNQFQTCSNFKVAILSITAANAGLNLSAANLVVFAELFWNPGILVQAEDRAHRIGQSDSVSVQYLVAQHTADDYIWPLVQNKLNTLSKAGLAKDDFADTDTTRLANKTQQSILDIFSSKFIDDTVTDVTDDKKTSDLTVNVQGVKPENVDVQVVSSSQQHVCINLVVNNTKNSVRTRTLRKCATAAAAGGDWTRKLPTKQAIMNSQITSLTQEVKSPTKQTIINSQITSRLTQGVKSPTKQAIMNSQIRSLTQGVKSPAKRQISITSFFQRTPPKKIFRLDDAEDVSLVTQQREDHEESLSNNHLDDDLFSDMPWMEEEFTNQCLDNHTNVISSLESNAVERSPCVGTSQESNTGDRSPCVGTSQESNRCSDTPNVSQRDLLWLDDLDWDDEM